MLENLHYSYVCQFQRDSHQEWKSSKNSRWFDKISEKEVSTKQPELGLKFKAFCETREVINSKDSRSHKFIIQVEYDTKQIID